MNITITKNGEIQLPFLNHSRSAIYATALHGATIELKVGGVLLTDGLLADNSQLLITQGIGAKVMLVTTGYVSPVEISVFPVV